MKMIPQGFKVVPGRRNEYSAIYQQIKTAHPAECCFLETGKTYRPISLNLEELQCIALALKKGGKNG